MIKVFNSDNYPSTTGTGLRGCLDVTYRDLVNTLGEPTINEESGDGKVQFEWICEFGGEVFTIYDWKTFDRHYTEYELDRFNVGGKTYAGDFIDEVESEISKYNNSLV